MTYTEEERQAVLLALKDPHGMHVLDHVVRACSLPPRRTIEVLHAMWDAGEVEMYGSRQYRPVKEGER